MVILLSSYLSETPTLAYVKLDDVRYERQVMDEVYNYLYTKNHPLSNWYYGHFHESWHAEIDQVRYHMLDIMELREIL